MNKGSSIAIVAIVGLSIAGSGIMTSYQDNNYNWFEKFSDFLNLNQFVGYLTGSPPPPPPPPPPPKPIHANMAMEVGKRTVGSGDGRYYQNVFDQCVFHSAEPFTPLCIKCDFLDKAGKVVAHGQLVELLKDYEPSTPIKIQMDPTKIENDIASNDIKNVESVQVELCADKCVPKFLDFLTVPPNLQHGSTQEAINAALASSGISVSAVANSPGFNKVILFSGDTPGDNTENIARDPDLRKSGICPGCAGKRILIIAENLDDTTPANGLIDFPDDNAKGGTLSIHMTTPMYVHSFLLVDHENDASAKAIAYDSANNPIGLPVPLPLTGDGGTVTVFVNKANVKRLDVTYMDSGGITNIDLRCAPPGEGCSLGFWKNHPEAWKKYKTTDKFYDIFGKTIKVDVIQTGLVTNPTLLQALNTQGGGINNLAKQSVAALLNSVALPTTFPYTTAQVISQFQTAFMTGDTTVMEKQAKKFDEANNLGGALCNGTSQSCPQKPSVTTSVLANGDVKVTYMQSLNLNDNSYGVNAVGWGTKGHTFKDLHNSDNLQFKFIKNSDGTVVLDFISDYITSTSGNTITTPGGVVIQTPSRYASLGPFGGDGSMLTGMNAWVKEYRSSFADNLNNNGYFTNGVQSAATKAQADLLINSPKTISSSSYTLVGGSLFTAWDFTNTYTVIISKNAFPGGFDKYSVVFPSIHNSPAKKCPTTETSKVIFSNGFEDTKEIYNWKFDSSRSDASSSLTKLEILTTDNADPAKARTGTKYLGGSGDFDPKFAAYNRSIDVSAYHGVKISLWYSNEDTETDDDYALYYKDGSTWVPIKVVPSSELNSSSGQTSWKNVIASIPDSVDNLQIQIRWSTSSTSEHMMLDDLEVTGISN